jgi:glycosyltransferase involved in cell wall biosynthesis/predicted metal-dependent phosphoesterase TrpH
MTMTGSGRAATTTDYASSAAVTDSGRTHASTDCSQVDMHCHSTASEISRLGVQRAMGLPECATPPQEVYELAKRRGMDFVTITDHDTIDGALAIAERPDVFVSEELTAHFRGEPQAVHVLCYGITPEDHEWLQAHSGDVELCAAYLNEREMACALAHPWYSVGAPLTARHRRRLAELFAVWETRNGARAAELNRPAAMYVATLDGIGIGGSDDHAGVDIGRTWTEAPAAATPAEFLEHMRAGRVRARGAQGSAAKWAHAAIALAARSLGTGPAEPASSGGEHKQPVRSTVEHRQSGTQASNGNERGEAAPDPRRVMSMVQRLLREADARHGGRVEDLSPDDARCLLRSWLSAVGLDHLDERGLIEYMQAEDFTHADLHRRACRAHERRLRVAVDRSLSAARGEEDPAKVAQEVFESCIAAIPYAPATAFLARERHKLREHREEGEPLRVAMLADGIGATHGVSRTIEEVRTRGVPGFEIEVVGTDPEVDRRLSAVAEVDVPFYPGLRIGVPSLVAAVQSLTDGGFDAIHVCSPGPIGVAGVLLARALGLPLIGSYHTELSAYAGMRSGQQRLQQLMDLAVRAFYGACEKVLSPSQASDEALLAAGVPAERIVRWDRGVDTTRFSPALRERPAWVQPTDAGLPAYVATSGSRLGDDGQPFDTPLRQAAVEEQPFNILYAGRVTSEKGVDLLADAFLTARAWEPRLHLQIAGGGPEQERLAERVGEDVTFLGWLHGEALARAYANADAFLFPSSTDTFGQVILEAQASGLPVVAVAAGGPLSLIEDDLTGLLCEPHAGELAYALLRLVHSPALRARLAQNARERVAGRTWEQTLERLASGYHEALALSADAIRPGAPDAPAGPDGPDGAAGRDASGSGRRTHPSPGRIAA